MYSGNFLSLSEDLPEEDAGPAEEEEEVDSGLTPGLVLEDADPELMKKIDSANWRHEDL